MISGHLQTCNNVEVQPFTLPRQNNDFTNVVTQGISREKLSSLFPQQIATTAAAKSSIKTMAREEDVEENGRGRPMNAVESRDPTIMYLVMLSYAELYKHEIKHILQNGKKIYAAIKLSKRFFWKTLISTLPFPTAKTFNK